MNVNFSPNLSQFSTAGALGGARAEGPARDASPGAPVDSFTPSQNGTGHEPGLMKFTRFNSNQSPAVQAEVAAAKGAAAVAPVQKAAEVPTEKEIKQLMEDWNQALQSRDPEKVAALYAKDALLQPTLSPDSRVDPKALKEYFEGFLKKGPKLVTKETKTEQLDLNAERPSHTGLYTFSFDKDPNATARFDFTYKRVDGQWKISKHTSNIPPNEPDKK
jgi:uncharacterized protein (TIGR02246 family)